MMMTWFIAASIRGLVLINTLIDDSKCYFTPILKLKGLNGLKINKYIRLRCYDACARHAKAMKIYDKINDDFCISTTSIGLLFCSEQLNINAVVFKKDVWKSYVTVESVSGPVVVIISVVYEASHGARAQAQTV